MEVVSSLRNFACATQLAFRARSPYGRVMQDLSDIPDLNAGMVKCGTCPIRHRAVCSYSSPAELSVLDDAKYYREYGPGQDIVSEGMPTQSLGSIVTGVAALHKTLEDGRRQMVGLLFPSDFIGRPLRPIAPYDAVALTPVRMCLFHRGKFEGIMATSPSLARRLLEMTLDELDAARNWMLLLGRKTALEKVASFIVILARRTAVLRNGDVHDGMAVEVPITRSAMAEFLGLTIETVSRQIGVMRQRGVIVLEDRRRIIIKDAAGLLALAGIDEADEDQSAFA